MKQQYISPRLNEFGTVEALTRYGTGGGSNDIVYLASVGGDAVLFFQTVAGLSVADAQVAVAGAIAASPGGDAFPVALSSIQGGATGKGSSFNPTLGTSFTV